MWKRQLTTTQKEIKVMLKPHIEAVQVTRFVEIPSTEHQPFDLEKRKIWLVDLYNFSPNVPLALAYICWRESPMFIFVEIILDQINCVSFRVILNIFLFEKYSDFIINFGMDFTYLCSPYFYNPSWLLANCKIRLQPFVTHNLNIARNVVSPSYRRLSRRSSDFRVRLID